MGNLRGIINEVLQGLGTGSQTMKGAALKLSQAACLSSCINLKGVLQRSSLGLL